MMATGSCITRPNGLGCDKGGGMKTSLGLTAMLISFLLGMVIAGGSMIATGGRLDTTEMAAQPLNIPTILVTCLDPLAILLEIVAIILIALGSRQVSSTHYRLVLAAIVCFVLWMTLNVGLFLPISFLGVQRRSLTMVKAGQVVKSGAALLQYVIPFLLAFGLSRKTPRVLLWLALIMTIVGNFGVVALPIAGIQLKPVESYGQTTYIPQFDVDYTAGPYPMLLAIGYIGGVLYMLVYALLAWQRWKQVRATQPVQVER